MYNLKHQCRPRRQAAMETAVGPAIELPGAGSGGDDGDGNVCHYNDALFSVQSEEVYLHADHGENPHGYSNCISLLAGGDTTPDGRVYVHGSQGVRLTAGPPGDPPSNNKNINGFELQVGELEEILIRRGVHPPEQTIQISPELMVIDSESLIAIQSKEEIKFSVAGGTSSITLTPGGIVINGPFVHIN